MKVRRFIGKLLLFGILLFIVDRGAGYVLEHYYFKCKSGENQQRTYSLLHTTEELLILGSSRACHHYVPRILEDSLGMSVYNTGYDGEEILSWYATLLGVFQRYTPKMILLDLTFLKSGDKETLAHFYPYYGLCEAFDSLFLLRSPFEKLKMQSYVYRYNSKLASVLSGNMLAYESAGGYFPLYGKLNIPMNDDLYEQNVILPYKITWLRKCIELVLAHQVKLVLVVSPAYYRTMPDFSIVEEIAKDYKLPFLNHFADSRFSADSGLFQDRTHLNHWGATCYTSIIASELKQYDTD